MLTTHAARTLANAETPAALSVAPATSQHGSLASPGPSGAAVVYAGLPPHTASLFREAGASLMCRSLNLVYIANGALVEAAEDVAARLGVGEAMLRRLAWEDLVPYMLLDGRAHFNFEAVAEAVQRHRDPADEMAVVRASRRRWTLGESAATPEDLRQLASRLLPPRPPARSGDRGGIPIAPGDREGRKRYAHRITGDADWSDEVAGVRRTRNSENLHKVYSIIRNSGRGGLSDFEGESLAGLTSNSYSPRRCELRDARLVVAKPHDRRQTPSGKTASVWVATAVLTESERAAYLAEAERDASDAA